MLVSESYVNVTEGYRCGDSDPQEAFSDDPGELFRCLRREHGRCIGKVYIDTDAGVKAIGWVFQARVKYDDCNDTFLREVWATLHDAPDTVTRERHYHELTS